MNHWRRLRSTLNITCTRLSTKAGLGKDYLKWLAKWDENVAMGLTTWAEMSDVAGSRSDCHAWGFEPEC
ncbi:MAG: hypothetical protein WDO15_27680 [Bacteroidota bacterium]